MCTTKLAETRSNTTVYYKACTHVPVLPYTTKLAQTRGFAASPIDTAMCAQQNELVFAAFPIDTELSTRKTTRKKNAKRRADQLEANKGPAPDPQTINGNPSLRIRESIAASNLNFSEWPHSLGKTYPRSLFSGFTWASTEFQLCNVGRIFQC